MIKVISNKHFASRDISDALIVPFWQSGKEVLCIGRFPDMEKVFRIPLQSGDFEAKNGELLWMYTDDVPEKRIGLLGLGSCEKVDKELLRRAYGAAFKASRMTKAHSLSVLFPKIPILPERDVLQAILEGILLADYNYTQKSVLESYEKKRMSNLFVIDAAVQVDSVALEVEKIIQGTNLTRDLVNANADEITPTYLAEEALNLTREHPKVTASIHGREWIDDKKMGLFSAVARGSSEEPRFIILQYKGKPASDHHVVFVGKGITYDTGGLNIKVANGMLDMRCDMAGAATVLGIIKAVALLELPVNISGVVASCENAIGPNAYKPGDVYTSAAGKTVEIVNTDAEGRLTLADALHYVSSEMMPSCIIDFATLTGGMEVALGSEASGLMSNSDALAQDLLSAGERTFERSWRLPLYEEYKDLLKSDIADLKNVSLKRTATPLVAGMFLKQFIGTTPWAHFDIASTAFIGDPKHYLPKGATGAGVRLAVEYLQTICLREASFTK